MDNLEKITSDLLVFRDDRNWGQFHTPKNLIMAINGESGELSSLCQWVNNSEIYENIELRNDVLLEMADIFIYLINLSIVLNVDLVDIANIKIEENEKRYPVDLCYGANTKADKL